MLLDKIVNKSSTLSTFVHQPWQFNAISSRQAGLIFMLEKVKVKQRSHESGVQDVLRNLLSSHWWPSCVNVSLSGVYSVQEEVAEIGYSFDTRHRTVPMHGCLYLLRRLEPGTRWPRPSGCFHVWLLDVALSAEVRSGLCKNEARLALGTFLQRCEKDKREVSTRCCSFPLIQLAPLPSPLPSYPSGQSRGYLSLVNCHCLRRFLHPLSFFLFTWDGDVRLRCKADFNTFIFIMFSWQRRIKTQKWL